MGRWLTERLRRLPDELGLGQRHFVCGVSSLAAGADTLFTRACRELGWPQRVFLPQPREDFLAATGSAGPDFPPDQRAEARALFESPHVIQERVLSEAADRHARFEDVNLELARVSDALVCLVRAEAGGKPGGTRDLLALAERRHRPVLEIRVGAGPGGAPKFEETWHWNPPPDAPPARQAGFVPPVLPPPLDELEYGGCGRPEPARYREALKTFASAKAGQMRRRFTLAAPVIVGTHVLATATALWAFKDHLSGWVPWLLAGLGYHEWLHRSCAAQRWALARLTAEVARSVNPLAGVPRALRHLFELPMPGELRPLLRTLNVLHLQGRRALDPAGWKARRDRYVSERLKQPKKGQIDYYDGELAGARGRLKLARGAFYIGSGGAVVATLGFLAVLLPVVAMAALSLAASLDLEARTHIYEEMLDFLKAQTALLNQAGSENEFAALAVETESRLLGETANWYARRAFTGVA